ncbi:MAG: methyltransferase [Cyclobacteriaceae bacterium]
MPNNYFQFKEFRILQGKCAMKVTTEGCLFGAMIAPIKPGRFLDIGTGTGLLSLMLAQKSAGSVIDAVEIDTLAAEQACTNFEASPWSERLRCLQTPIQHFLAPEKYDLIVSNPPFFKESLKGSSNPKNVAKHEQSLDQADLIAGIDRLLAEEGRFWVLYPPLEAERFADLARDLGYKKITCIHVYDKPGSKMIRVVLQFTKESDGECNPQDFYIKTDSEGYSMGFASLLAPYYLHL